MDLLPYNGLSTQEIWLKRKKKPYSIPVVANYLLILLEEWKGTCESQQLILMTKCNTAMKNPHAFTLTPSYHFLSLSQFQLFPFVLSTKQSPHPLWEK